MRQEHIVQIAIGESDDDRTIIALSSEGRIFKMTNSEGWKEIRCPLESYPEFKQKDANTGSIDPNPIY